jgi:addiction module HigA family antidote
MTEIIGREDLERIDWPDVSTGERIGPVRPGDVLGSEFMEPLSLSARALARDMSVPANRVTAILNGTRAITAPTALLLAKRFGTSAEFWMNLQTAHDLEAARNREASTLGGFRS